MVDWTGRTWAQPVEARRWVPVCVVLEKAKRWTGYRFPVLARAAHRSWQHATRT